MEVVEMAGGRIGEEFDGEEGVEVGDVGRVWGENVIDGGEGGSRVVDDVIWTISVSIYHQPFFLSSRPSLQPLCSNLTTRDRTLTAIYTSLAAERPAQRLELELNSPS
jgi:hypothetical protein